MRALGRLGTIRFGTLSSTDGRLDPKPFHAHVDVAHGAVLHEIQLPTGATLTSAAGVAHRPLPDGCASALQTLVGTLVGDVEAAR